jgi:hypothetical protein
MQPYMERVAVPLTSCSSLEIVTHGELSRLHFDVATFLIKAASSRLSLLEMYPSWPQSLDMWFCSQRPKLSMILSWTSPFWLNYFQICYNLGFAFFLSACCFHHSKGIIRLHIRLVITV